MKYKTDDSAILLTKFAFSRLLDAVIHHFKTSHTIRGYKDSQLYGFGNYDSERPNLKNDLELVLRGYVNGKYLYNKQREVASGKPIVKISREYRNLFFNYLGYKGPLEFIENEITDREEKEKQLQLLHTNASNETHYYVMYYYGEDRKMTKGQLIIYNNWKTFDIKFVYFNSRQEYTLFELFGTIKQENNFVHFDCKHFMSGNKIEGAKMIFYVGLSSFNERPILIGTYSSFDKYDHSISGKMLFVRAESKLSMEQESKSMEFDPIICQELVKKRLIVTSRLPKQLSKISPQSPYASIFGKVPNAYRAIFSVGNEEITFDFHIQKHHYSITSDTEDIEIENDRVSIESKGQILELHFSVIGIFLLQKVSLYLKVYNLLSEEKRTTGQFSGIDINNNIVSGKLEVSLRG
ncbi:hypothetical protein [Flagellimonas sp. CMM7]|uniref:hypothetical protein n=1 Tax=Flagellimonas sp. CMM7 TaxID=2654676 RepID=UPI0013CFBB91|nr:hypothetical protein [Flagellimonas sp. CMM7]UII78792.1 hypothetical protein LV704_14115 [Flagellimonas sp. CMM7]